MAPKSSPRDVFLHLLAIITLYIAAVSFGALLFQYVDHFFPDILNAPYGSISPAIRWAIASLIIVFPVYIWISWFLGRDQIAHPEKRELRVRRWLLYFTLFLAAIVIIIDLVTLIYNFLGGDLTVRFLLKIVAVLFIAAAIFGYYLWGLRREGIAVRDPMMRFFIWAVVLIVAAATIGGFFLVGSPFQERLRRFDEQRVSDLQTIQWQIINYWQSKGKIPASLDDLRDPISGFVSPTDPETGASYEYQVTDTRAFELCATFKTASRETQMTGVRQPIPAGIEYGTPIKGIPDSWAHAAERVCFSRTIDPDLYPVQPKKL